MWWRSSKANLVGLPAAGTETDAAAATCKGALHALSVTRQVVAPPQQWAAAHPPPRLRVYIDNQAAITMLNKQPRGRNRHMDIRLKFLQMHADIETFDFLYIPTADLGSVDVRNAYNTAHVVRAQYLRDPTSTG